MEKDKLFDCDELSSRVDGVPGDEKKEWKAPVLTTWKIADETQSAIS